MIRRVASLMSQVGQPIILEGLQNFIVLHLSRKLAALAQMVACLPLVQEVWGSIPGGVVDFNLKIFNFRARRAGDVHFLIARLYITVLD